MAQIHEMLCEQGNFRNVDLGSYLEQLIAKIDQMMGRMFARPKIEFHSGQVTIPAERALLCGMVLNELMINIYKHAFVGREEPGTVQVKLTQKDNLVHLTVSDDGIGLPASFNSGKGKSIGMWIVRDMLNKLKGTLDIKQEAGVRCDVKFPVS